MDRKNKQIVLKNLIPWMSTTFCNYTVKIWIMQMVRDNKHKRKNICFWYFKSCPAHLIFMSSSYFCGEVDIEMFVIFISFLESDFSSPFLQERMHLKQLRKHCYKRNSLIGNRILDFDWKMCLIIFMPDLLKYCSLEYTVNYII